MQQIANSKSINESGYTGAENFYCGTHEQPFSLLNFWRWGVSNLLDNTTRGLLAEYLVAVAVRAKEPIRREWSAWDLTTPTGIRLEVKCAAYLQNWKQNTHSAIRFGIQATLGWDADTGKYDSEVKRRADYYIFCLFTHKDQKSANPLQLEQWTFWILPSNVLNVHCPGQKSIGLSKLLSLGARQCSWDELCQYPFERISNAESSDD